MLSEHLLPDIAKFVLFTPIDKLLLEKSKVFEVPLTQEDLETFDWCTWPTRSWYWESQTTLIRILVIRLFWLQYFCAKGPTSIRYWSFLAMDQHIPMILWCEKKGRAPSYMECIRDKLVPKHVQPLCEETLCVTEYGLQDLLEQDSKNDFFKVFSCCGFAQSVSFIDPFFLLQVVIKSLPRRCICRDVEERALAQMESGDTVAQIFKWMRLGNNRNAQWRPSLADRVRIYQETPEEAVKIAKKTQRSLAHALSEFVAVTILNCHAYCQVMSDMMEFKNFWQNTRQLCDRVFRPSLCEAMKGNTPDTVKMERIWNKKKRPSPYRKDAAGCLETFLKLLTTASNANQRPVRPSVITAALSVNFPEHLEHALTMMPNVTEEAIDIFHEMSYNVVSRKQMVTVIKTLDADTVHILASFLQAYVKPNATSLVPLPIHFYRAQEAVSKTYRICPLCSSFDFNVVGWKRSPCQFESCPKRDWILVSLFSRCLFVFYLLVLTLFQNNRFAPNVIPKECLPSAWKCAGGCSTFKNTAACCAASAISWQTAKWEGSPRETTLFYVRSASGKPNSPLLVLVESVHKGHSSRNDARPFHNNGSRSCINIYTMLGRYSPSF
jgi:hypothetical protein